MALPSHTLNRLTAHGARCGTRRHVWQSGPCRRQHRSRAARLTGRRRPRRRMSRKRKGQEATAEEPSRNERKRTEEEQKKEKRKRRKGKEGKEREKQKQVGRQRSSRSIFYTCIRHRQVVPLRWASGGAASSQLMDPQVEEHEVFIGMPLSGIECCGTRTRTAQRIAPTHSTIAYSARSHCTGRLVSGGSAGGGCSRLREVIARLFGTCADKLPALGPSRAAPIHPARSINQLRQPTLQ